MLCKVNSENYRFDTLQANKLYRTKNKVVSSNTEKICWISRTLSGLIQEDYMKFI